MTDHKAVAKRLLNHYLRQAAAGRSLTDGDCIAEIDEIVECIVKAATEATVERIVQQAKQFRS